MGKTRPHTFNRLLADTDLQTRLTQDLRKFGHAGTYHCKGTGQRRLQRTRRRLRDKLAVRQALQQLVRAKAAGEPGRQQDTDYRRHSHPMRRR